MNKRDINNLLDSLSVDCLLVNSTNEFLVEYPQLSENARYTLTGFSGSTGDALITKDKIYLFVDGRYHIQADEETDGKGLDVIKLQLGQKQDEEIIKRIPQNAVLGIVSKKVSQRRLENFSNVKIRLLDTDPVNNYTEPHNNNYEKAFNPVNYDFEPSFISNLEEVSYLTGLRDFSNDCSAKIWSKLFVDGNKKILFKNNSECEEFLKNYKGNVTVDKALINAYDYSLIKNPVNKPSVVAQMKSVKSNEEVSAYKKAFENTDKAVNSVRNYIEQNENLSEYDIAKKLREEFIGYGAKSLSFNSIVAINQHSALAHYSKNSKDTFLKEGDLVLIDCGAYYESGLATDITRVFVKGEPNELQKRVYTTVLKTFLNAYHSDAETGYEIDCVAHSMLDGAIDGFVFNHGLGHGIGINVHEAPPNLSQNEVAKCKIKDGMCFTIEPGLYNKDYFGVRLENSCYREDGKTRSFVKMGYEKKLIDFSLLNEQEKEWLNEFDLI